MQYYPNNKVKENVDICINHIILRISIDLLPNIESAHSIENVAVTVFTYCSLNSCKLSRILQGKKPNI